MRKKRLTPIEWDQVEQDYTIGWVDKETGKTVLPSVKELAYKYNVTPSTIYRKAKKEDWENLRDLMKTQAQKESEQKERESHINKLKEFNQDFLTIVNSAKTLILMKMYRKVKGTDDEFELDPYIDVKDLNQLIATAKIAHDLGNNIIESEDEHKDSGIDALVKLFSGTLNNRDYGVVS